MIATTIKKNKCKTFNRKEEIETLALAFNPRNKAALAIIHMLEQCGLFDVMREDEPNDETLKAIEAAHNGDTYKAKNLEDLIKYLEA